MYVWKKIISKFRWHCISVWSFVVVFCCFLVCYCFGFSLSFVVVFVLFSGVLKFSSIRYSPSQRKEDYTN